MDLWNRAREFAEDAAKKSHEMSIEAAKKSQDLFVTKGIGAAKEIFSQDFVSEASKKAELIKNEAFKRADQIKSLASDIEIPNPISKISDMRDKQLSHGDDTQQLDFARFGVTDELREFVRGLTLVTFRDFPMEDEHGVLNVPAVSNIRQDLNEWQARHATLVLSTVKEISNFRYELCPRYMKERKFWQIYFILVNTYVTPYEKTYFESKDILVKQEKEVPKEAKEDASTSNTEVKDTEPHSKSSSTATADHDLDAFLLGDLGSSDDEPDGGCDDLEDDL